MIGAGELQTEVVYLDYAGSALPAKSMLQDNLEQLLKLPLSNPHSRGGKLGDRTSSAIEMTRNEVLNFLGVDEADYIVVFTSGCTSSLKMIGEMFPWSSIPGSGLSEIREDGSNKNSNHSLFVYSANSHNSLMGIRQYSPFWSTIDAKYFFENKTFSEEEWKDIIESVVNNRQTGHISPHLSKTPPISLLGVPGECNFTGAKLNVDNLIACLNVFSASRCASADGGDIPSNLWWILDGAKLFADSHFLINEKFPPRYRPDFITLSFYKIFGFPTGLGALVMKKDKTKYMKKTYFGGGTLLAGAANSSFLIPKSPLSPAYFEDGTINFQGIVSLQSGFRFVDRLGGMKAIEIHSHQYRLYLLNRMQSLVHGLTNRRLCVVYNFCAEEYLSGQNIDSGRQGPVIAFNLVYVDGNYVPFGVVNEKANAALIQLRTGCFCNLGGCQEILRLSAEDVEINYYRGRQCSEDRDRAADILYEKPTGACRVSVGYGTTKEDCDAFIQFLKDQFLNQVSPSVDEEEEYNPLKSRYHHRLLTSSAETSGPTTIISDFDLFWTKKVQCFVSDSVISESQIVASALDESLTHSSLLMAIYVYPVKSCAGVRVDNWPLLPSTGQGLLYDRIFAIIDGDGRVLSQKLHPYLALIRPYFVFDHVDEDLPSKVYLRLTSPFNQSDLELSLDLPFVTNDTQPQASVEPDSNNDTTPQVLRVCGRRLASRRISSDADEWITTFFHNAQQSETFRSVTSDTHYSTFHIVKATETNQNSKSARVIGSNNIDKSQITVSSSSFANTAQFLLLSNQSVRSLIHLISKEEECGDECGKLSCDDDGKDSIEITASTTRRSRNIKVENFRPNLVVTSIAAHEEDTWKSIRFPARQLLFRSSKDEMLTKSLDISMDITGPCTRCTMVDVNSDTGRNECRVFEALDAYRKQRGYGVCFGQFLAVAGDNLPIPDTVHIAEANEVQDKSSLLFLKVGSKLLTQIK